MERNEVVTSAGANPTGGKLGRLAGGIDSSLKCKKGPPDEAPDKAPDKAPGEESDEAPDKAPKFSYANQRFAASLISDPLNSLHSLVVCLWQSAYARGATPKGLGFGPGFLLPALLPPPNPPSSTRDRARTVRIHNQGFRPLSKLTARDCFMPILLSALRQNDAPDLRARDKQKKQVESHVQFYPSPPVAVPCFFVSLKHTCTSCPFPFPPFR